MLRLTEKYELEEEIARLKHRERILERENEDLRTRASIMCRKTFELLQALKMPVEDIFKYYKETT